MKRPDSKDYRGDGATQDLIADLQKYADHLEAENKSHQLEIENCHLVLEAVACAPGKDWLFIQLACGEFLDSVMGEHIKWLLAEHRKFKETQENEQQAQG